MVLGVLMGLHVGAVDQDAALRWHEETLKAVKLKLWQRGVECGSVCDGDDLEAHQALLAAAVAGGRRPVLPARSGHCAAAFDASSFSSPFSSFSSSSYSSALYSMESPLRVRGGAAASDCTPPPPDMDALAASLGPEFAAVIAQNEVDHQADCRESCSHFYCGDASLNSSTPTPGSSSGGGSGGGGGNGRDPSAVVPPVSSHHFGEVPPEDFASDFNFPLDLIKVTAEPLFTAAECQEAVATAESEDVHLNEYVSGKYKLGGDWIKNMPKTLKWFNAALEEKIFPTLASLFPEVIRGPEVLRAHSVAMLKYNSSHPRTDVHVDNGIIALTLALSPSAQYKGGGTFFEHMGPDKVLPMDVGHATFRPGSVRHGGHPVTEGERYIVGGGF